VLAQQTWKEYISGNDSVIMEMFHGLLKSTLVCNGCMKLSVKFEPFVFLSCPVPKQLEITVIRSDYNQAPIKVKAKAPATTTTEDVWDIVNNMMDIPADKLVVTVIKDNKCKVLMPSKNLDNGENFFVYERPDTPDSPTWFIPVFIREKSSQRSTEKQETSFSEVLSHPLFVSVPKEDCTYDTLYECVLNCLRRYIRPEKQGAPLSESEDTETTHDGQCLKFWP
ncbi:hypothetical protein MTO96_042719, partial [Rhipicephalus appendiculatus]